MDPKKKTAMIQEKRLLVIDTKKSLQGPYREELTSEGYRVSFEGNGHVGLTKTHEESLDLVILDLAILRTDGLQVLGWMHEEGKCWPMVMDSKDPVYPNQFMSWVANAFFGKSANSSNLKRTIRSFLQETKETSYNRSSSDEDSDLSLAGHPLSKASQKLPSESFLG